MLHSVPKTANSYHVVVSYSPNRSVCVIGILKVYDEVFEVGFIVLFSDHAIKDFISVSDSFSSGTATCLHTQKHKTLVLFFFLQHWIRFN